MDSSAPINAPTETAQKPRKIHRKVKSGCRTCKQVYDVPIDETKSNTLRARRVKCDEAYPACNRCITAGRVCDGYGIWGGGTASQQDVAQLVHARKPPATYPAGGFGSTRIALRAGPSTTPGIRVSSEQLPYMEWFIHGTAEKSPRIFNSPFWDPVVFQAIMKEPMVLSAVLAVSAAHKRRTLDPTNQPQEGAPPDQSEIFLLRHYNSAMNNLQAFIAKNDDLTQPRRLLVIITCALFVLLEYLRKDDTVGIIHFQSSVQVALVHLRTAVQLARRLKLQPSDSAIIQFILQFHDMLFDQTEPVQTQKQPFPSGLPTPASSPPTSPSTSPPPPTKPVTASFASPTPPTTDFPLLIDSIPTSIAPPPLPLPTTLRFASPTHASVHLSVIIDAIPPIAEQSRLIPLSETAARARICAEHDDLIAALDTWLQAQVATVADLGAGISSSDATEYAALVQRWAMTRRLADKSLGTPAGGAGEAAGTTK